MSYKRYDKEAIFDLTRTRHHDNDEFVWSKPFGQTKARRFVPEQLSTQRCSRIYLKLEDGS